MNTRRGAAQRSPSLVYRFNESKPPQVWSHGAVYFFISIRMRSNKTKIMIISFIRRAPFWGQILTAKQHLKGSIAKIQSLVHRLCTEAVFYCISPGIYRTSLPSKATASGGRGTIGQERRHGTLRKYFLSFSCMDWKSLLFERSEFWLFQSVR